MKHGLPISRAIGFLFAVLLNFGWFVSPAQAQGVIVTVPEILFLRTAASANGCVGQPITNVAVFWSNASQNLTVTTTILSGTECSGSVVSTNSFTAVPLGLVTPSATLDINESLSPGQYGWQIRVTSPTNLSLTDCIPLSVSGLSSVSIAANATPACVGESRSLSAVVVGYKPGNVTFNWYREGQLLNVPQSTSVLVISAVSLPDAGNYSVVASSCNSVTSSGFTLSVNPTPTATITFPNSMTVQGTGIPIVQVPPLSNPNSFQASGGNLYERMMILDRLNGYEIQQKDSNTTGIFPITRLGLFTLTVTGVNGCRRTVQWMVQPQ